MTTTKTRPIKIYNEPIKNGLFGAEHARMVEEAQKVIAEQQFTLRIERKARSIIRNLAESVSGLTWVTPEHLPVNVASGPQAAGLMEAMYKAIKKACYQKGDFWYEIELEDCGWEIRVSRGKAK